jgi:D-beta-D-heptose 7-phosphate kinase / D-beta-D-heptose 1-phosphate adenosyltransferase
MSEQVTDLAPIFYFRESEDRDRLTEWREELRKQNKKLVFTNGVFDILHAGHVTYLAKARSMGDVLIIGLNSDASTRSIKGPKRPLQHEEDRARLLSGLKSCDAVAVFDQDTPFELIELVIPDILVKGGDYTVDTIVGRETVERNGGKVLPLAFVEGRSTTGIVERIVERYGK